ncbi:MAG: helix-turn-helix transcriptional regulator [Bacilli bacterium]
MKGEKTLYGKELKIKFKQNLKNYRLNKSLTQSSFAEILEIDDKFYQRLESNVEENFYINTAIKISQKLEVPFISLFSEISIVPGSICFKENYANLLTKNLEKQRSLRKLTQKEFSSLIGVSPKTYSRIKNNEKYSSCFDTLITVCINLGITFDRLFIE